MVSSETTGSQDVDVEPIIDEPFNFDLDSNLNLDHPTSPPSYQYYPETTYKLHSKTLRIKNTPNLPLTSILSMSIGGDGTDRTGHRVWSGSLLFMRMFCGYQGNAEGCYYEFCNNDDSDFSNSRRRGISQNTASFKDLHNRLFANGTRVLELGCGSGVAGLSLIVSGVIESVDLTLSDGDRSVIGLVDENFKINGLNEGFGGRGVYLRWREDFDVVEGEEPEADIQPPHTIIAIDVAYDLSILKPLLHTVRRIFNRTLRERCSRLLPDEGDEKEREKEKGDGASTIELIFAIMHIPRANVNDSRSVGTEVEIVGIIVEVAVGLGFVLDCEAFYEGRDSNGKGGGEVEEGEEGSLIVFRYDPAGSYGWGANSKGRKFSATALTVALSLSSVAANFKDVRTHGRALDDTPEEPTFADIFESANSTLTTLTVLATCQGTEAVEVPKIRELLSAGLYQETQPTLTAELATVIDGLIAAELAAPVTLAGIAIYAGSLSVSAGVASAAATGGGLDLLSLPACIVACSAFSGLTTEADIVNLTCELIDASANCLANGQTGTVGGQPFTAEACPTDVATTTATAAAIGAFYALQEVSDGVHCPGQTSSFPALYFQIPATDVVPISAENKVLVDAMYASFLKSSQLTNSVGQWIPTGTSQYDLSADTCAQMPGLGASAANCAVSSVKGAAPLAGIHLSTLIATYIGGGLATAAAQAGASRRLDTTDLTWTSTLETCAFNEAFLGVASTRQCVADNLEGSDASVIASFTVPNTGVCESVGVDGAAASTKVQGFVAAIAGVVAWIAMM